MSHKDLLQSLIDDRGGRAILAQCQMTIDDRNVLILRVPDPVWAQFRPLLNQIKPCRLEVDSIWIWRGDQLWVQAIYRIARGRAEQAGIDKRFSPHRGRHSSITAAVELTGGDVRKVQNLSRHRKVETVLVYVDNAKGSQGEVSGGLADLI